MRLTTMTRGRLISSAYCQTFSVTTSTPETPSTTTAAASAADMAILASWANRFRPGESSRSEVDTSQLQSPDHLLCRLLLSKKKPMLPQQEEHKIRQHTNART